MCFRLSFLCVLTLAVLLISSVVLAQVMPPPRVGFLFDREAHSFRPILGSPGASILGEPLKLELSVEDAQTIPGQEFALALIGPERIPAVLPLNGDPAPVRWIDGALHSPTSVFLSSSGTAGVLYDAQGRKLQTVTGLAASPVVVREIDLFHLPPELTALAVSDDAETLLLGFAEGEMGSVFMLGSGGTESFVLGPGRASAIVFLAHSANALVADAENDTVYMLQQREGGLETVAIADARDGVSAPEAIAVTADNRWAFVLNSREGTIVGIDLAGGPPQAFSCPCRPAGLHRLSGSFAFQLTELSPGPVWLLDGNPSERRVVFVPPAPAELP